MNNVDSDGQVAAPASFIGQIIFQESQPTRYGEVGEVACLDLFRSSDAASAAPYSASLANTWLVHPSLGGTRIERKIRGH